MEYANHLNEYAPAWSAAQVDQEVARIREAAKRNHNTEVYKLCYSAIDLTTLSCNDSVTSVTEFARKAADGMDRFSASLKDKEINEIAEDARSAVRNNPAIAVGAAAVIGFALARFLKGGSDD